MCDYALLQGREAENRLLFLGGPVCNAINLRYINGTLGGKRCGSLQMYYLLVCWQGSDGPMRAYLLW